MHGLLAVHLGMMIRLLEALDLANGLVKDAEGQIVDIVVNPLDQEAVDEAFANGASQIYLRHMPLGFWVRMETYTAAPFVDILEDHDGSLTSDVTKGLVFIEARTSEPFGCPAVRKRPTSAGDCVLGSHLRPLEGVGRARFYKHEALGHVRCQGAVVVF